MKLPRLLLLVVAVPILALNSAHAQTSYQLTGLCQNGICFTNIPTESLDVYIDANHVPYQIGVYTPPFYNLTETLPVAPDGTFPGGSLTNVDVVTVTHRSGRFATKTVTFTGTIKFDAPGASPVNTAAIIQDAGTAYTASRGYVSSTNTATLDFDAGGSAAVYVNLSSACNYGQPCTFIGREVQYTLPDATTATLTNLTGTFDGSGTIAGTASGVDSKGHIVSVAVTFSFAVVCRSGRGGGCTKTFVGGSLTVTVLPPGSAGPGMLAPLLPQNGSVIAA